MSDGFNAQNEQLTQEQTGGQRSLMEALAKADGFGPMVTTTDVIGGMPGVPKMVPLTSNEGTIFAEHHEIRVLPITSPVQDVPPGESKTGA